MINLKIWCNFHREKTQIGWATLAKAVEYLVFLVQTRETLVSNCLWQRRVTIINLRIRWAVITKQSYILMLIKLKLRRLRINKDSYWYLKGTIMGWQVSRFILIKFYYRLGLLKENITPSSHKLNTLQQHCICWTSIISVNFQENSVLSWGISFKFTNWCDIFQRE